MWFVPAARLPVIRLQRARGFASPSYGGFAFFGTATEAVISKSYLKATFLFAKMQTSAKKTLSPDKPSSVLRRSFMAEGESSLWDRAYAQPLAA